MVATKNQPAPKNDCLLNPTQETIPSTESEHPKLNNLKNIHTAPQLFLQSRSLANRPKTGVNSIVDAAATLFTLLGKLKYLTAYRQPLPALQKEIFHEINLFQETIKNHGYNAEYVMVCRYVICATFDDIISNTVWGSQGGWEPYCLLTAFNQDQEHHEKFFMILERSLKEPSLYIDLMEMIYICLSVGYKGAYRSTEYNQYQLEQITNTLYKHIQVHRGHFSKTLSPIPFKIRKNTTHSDSLPQPSLFSIFLMSASIIMILFISLGYLMDTISNEAFKNLLQSDHSVSQETFK